MHNKFFCTWLLVFTLLANSLLFTSYDVQAEIINTEKISMYAAILDKWLAQEDTDNSKSNVNRQTTIELFKQSNSDDDLEVEQGLAFLAKLIWNKNLEPSQQNIFEQKMIKLQSLKQQIAKKNKELMEENIRYKQALSLLQTDPYGCHCCAYNGNVCIAAFFGVILSFVGGALLASYCGDNCLSDTSIKKCSLCPEPCAASPKCPAVLGSIVSLTSIYLITLFSCMFFPCIKNRCKKCNYRGNKLKQELAILKQNLAGEISNLIDNKSDTYKNKIPYWEKIVTWALDYYGARDWASYESVSLLISSSSSLSSLSSSSLSSSSVTAISADTSSSLISTSSPSTGSNSSNSNSGSIGEDNKNEIELLEMVSLPNRVSFSETSDPSSSSGPDTLSSAASSSSTLP